MAVPVVAATTRETTDPAVVVGMASPPTPLAMLTIHLLMVSTMQTWLCKSRHHIFLTHIEAIDHVELVHALLPSLPQPLTFHSTSNTPSKMEVITNTRTPTRPALEDPDRNKMRLTLHHTISTQKIHLIMSTTQLSHDNKQPKADRIGRNTSPPAPPNQARKMRLSYCRKSLLK